MVENGDRPRGSASSRNETAALQGLNHLVDGRGRHEEVPRDICFGRGDTEPGSIPGDDLEVLPLATGGLRHVADAVSPRVVRTRSQGSHEAAMLPIDRQDGAVCEMNLEASSTRLLDVRHQFP